MENNNFCPLPALEPDRIRLGHGGGGWMTDQLIQNLFIKNFSNEHLLQAHDGAILNLPSSRLALTTDSYVVSPLFFPGGDIGKLAVHGTLNDLAMCGARPLYLSLAFIIEEGFEMEKLERIVHSIKQAALENSVSIVTGDTKVVQKGKGDSLFINTTGLGTVPADLNIGPFHLKGGEAIIISGDIGRHGICIMGERENFQWGPPIESDTCCLSPLVNKLLEASLYPHCLRDITRGGLCSTLNEISLSSGLNMELEESLVPVSAEVKAACEILGLDPFQVASEGRMVVMVDSQLEEPCLKLMRSHPLGKGARCIGRVAQVRSALGSKGRVTVRNKFGVSRFLDNFSGELLPRIC